jgi:NAD(P)H dehydrogenase (quinone)
VYLDEDGVAMFAIIGANGNAGTAAARELRNRDIPVRAVLRDRSKAPAFEAMGCSVAIADILDRQALKAAIEGAQGVQAICPVAPRAETPLLAMRAYADAIGEALTATRPERVVAISDFGAEIGAGVGVTLAFHFLEARLREAHTAPILLRSAEHMQNWARVLRPAAETGVLPSFHHPLTKLFPMVSAEDVGRVAADLLSAARYPTAPHIAYVEGPRRYTPFEVAETFSRALGRQIVAGAGTPPARFRAPIGSLCWSAAASARPTPISSPNSMTRTMAALLKSSAALPKSVAERRILRICRCFRNRRLHPACPSEPRRAS